MLKGPGLEFDSLGGELNQLNLRDYWAINIILAEGLCLSFASRRITDFLDLWRNYENSYTYFDSSTIYSFGKSPS